MERNVPFEVMYLPERSRGMKYNVITVGAFDRAVAFVGTSPESESFLLMCPPLLFSDL